MPNVTLKSKIHKIGRAEAYRIASMALRWCRRKLGINKRKRTEPVWYIHKGYAHENGEYDASDNEIFIYWNNCDDVHEMIATCIHEWTHQLQPILTRYNDYPDYRTNPYEIEAKGNEALYTGQCWDYIKSKINKRKQYEHSNRKTKRSRSCLNE
jgi:hypothetical protein